MQATKSIALSSLYCKELSQYIILIGVKTNKKQKTHHNIKPLKPSDKWWWQELLDAQTLEKKNRSLLYIAKKWT